MGPLFGSTSITWKIGVFVRKIGTANKGGACSRLRTGGKICFEDTPGLGVGEQCIQPAFDHEPRFSTKLAHSPYEQVKTFHALVFFVPNILFEIN